MQTVIDLPKSSPATHKLKLQSPGEKHGRARILQPLDIDTLAAEITEHRFSPVVITR